MPGICFKILQWWWEKWEWEGIVKQDQQSINFWSWMVGTWTFMDLLNLSWTQLSNLTLSLICRFFFDSKDYSIILLSLVESKFIVIVSFRVLQRNRINRIDISVSICHLSLSIDLLWALVHAVLEAKQSHSLPLQAEEPRKASSIRSPSLGAWELVALMFKGRKRSTSQLMR